MDKLVKCIGEKNVVQVITNNGYNHALVGKILFDKFLKVLFILFTLKHYIPTSFIIFIYYVFYVKILYRKVFRKKKWSHLYWTPCVAHCIILILEDIGKLPIIKRTLIRVLSLNEFTYNYVRVLIWKESSPSKENQLGQT